MVDEHNRSDLNYDIAENGRYHHQSVFLRQVINETSSATQKTALFRKYGFTKHASALLKICPSLNLQTFFPSDPCHSEYAGISKMAHYLLVSAVLTPSGQEQYLRALQKFPFPRGWGRLQSPITHLESYQLQEHARASLLIPLILRCCFKESWIQPAILRALPIVFSIEDTSGVGALIKVFTAIAKSNSILTTSLPISYNRQEIQSIIIMARKLLQQLIDAIVTAVDTFRSRAVSRSQSRRPSRGPSLPPFTPEPAEPAEQTQQVEQAEFSPAHRTKVIQGMKNRPNMHIGLHYLDQIKEYALANNCNVLSGEDKHRDYKLLVYRTNHKDVEKFLLQQESYRKTIELSLYGAFSEEQPELTETLHALYAECPSVFNNLLRLDAVLPNNDLAEAPPSYKSLNVWSVLPSHIVVGQLNIPSPKLATIGNMHPFIKMLRKAYEIDWCKPSVLEPGPRPIQFYRKVSFVFDNQSHRTTIMQGDIVPYRSNKLGQVQAIFTHILRDVRRVFLCIVDTREIKKDPLLALPILQLSSEPYIVVGLPAVKPSQYIIPVNINSNNNALQLRPAAGAINFIQCQWDISFL